MTNKSFLVGMMTMALVFGMAVVSCDNSTNADGTGTGYVTPYEGTWNFTVYGQNATVTITGYTWVFTGTGPGGVNLDDNGTFTLNGNVATLFSYGYNGAKIGTATMTTDTTVTLNLDGPSQLPSPLYGTKE